MLFLINLVLIVPNLLLFLSKVVSLLSDLLVKGLSWMIDKINSHKEKIIEYKNKYLNNLKSS